MALTRPTLLPVAAFDANQEQVFNFTIQGGASSAQITANELIIRNQDNNSIVYDKKQETFAYVHTVSANELQNGVYYNATLIVYDADNNKSVASLPIQFWCYTQPTIEFTNIPTNGVINNASFSFEFEYNQAEDEPLNTYIINLYNSAQVLISSSSEQYTNSTAVPFSGSYLFNGFDNTTTYFVQIVGNTLEDTVIYSQMRQISIQYTQPDAFTLLQLVNNCDEGYITLRSNIVLIDGESNPSPPKYIEDAVDLRDSGSWVAWNQGYTISGNYLTRLWFYDPNPYSQILEFSNTSGDRIVVKYMLGYENEAQSDIGAYLEVYATNVLQSSSYYIYSNYVIPPLNDTQVYTMFLTKLDNIYQVQLLSSTS